MCVSVSSGSLSHNSGENKISRSSSRDLGGDGEAIDVSTADLDGVAVQVLADDLPFATHTHGIETGRQVTQSIPPTS
jgi:hypothetical protein